MKRKNEGITLISLVITVIIMLILAGVVITLTLGNNGLIGRAKEAKEKTNKQAAVEQISLKITNYQLDKYAKEQRDLNLQELADIFYEDEEIEYIKLDTTQPNSKEKIEIGEHTSFFTKLKEYPYEFEIDSSLNIKYTESVEEKNTGTENLQKISIESVYAQLLGQNRWTILYDCK